MKKLLMAALLLIGFGATAQEHGIRKQTVSPEQRNEAQLKKLTSELQLTEAQQKEMATVIADQSAKREALMKERMEKKDERAKQTAEERQARLKKINDERAATKERVRKILTAEQFEKWEKMNAEKRNHMVDKAKAKRNNAETAPQPQK